MTSAREDAAPAGSVGPGERSIVRTLRGLRWWGSLALAGVLTVAGVAVDLVLSGELAVVFVACFAGGCVLATAWARRDELFLPMVQPPLLLVVAVPAVVAATGSLPSSGSTVSVLLAVGGPLINAFPTLAVTTAVCLAVGFVRTRIEPWQRPDPDELDADPVPARDAPRRPARRPGDEQDRERRPQEARDRPRRPADERRRDDPRTPDDGPPRRPARPMRPLRPADTGRRDDPRADPREDFGPGVRRVPRRVDGPDDRRPPRS